MRNIKNYLEPFFIVRKLSRYGFLNFLPDKAYLKLAYRAKFGKKLDLKNPITYNEKLQWLKLYDRNPKYVGLVDKIQVRDYVSSTIGSEYLVPLIGTWDSADKIDFDSLPSQFVLKCNHDSGSVVVCKDKSKFDSAFAISSLNASLKRGTFYYGREWPYKLVKPMVLAEEYLEDSTYGELRDYKFFCFGGKVKSMLVASGRLNSNSSTKIDYFDENYNHLDLRRGHPTADVIPEKPLNFEKMKELAERLSDGFTHVRIDFYEVNGRVYFGEMTFYPGSGLREFEPEEWDKIFGDWVKLEF